MTIDEVLLMLDDMRMDGRIDYSTYSELWDAVASLDTADEGREAL